MDLKEVRRRQQRKASQAIAEMIKAQDWDVFASFRPRRPTTSGARLLELVDGQLSAAAQAAASPHPRWIGFSEPDEHSPEPQVHVQALLQYPKRVREELSSVDKDYWREDQEHRWAGDADLPEYVPGGGAAEYIAKQFGRPETEFWIGGPARSPFPAGPAVGRRNSAA